MLSEEELAQLQSRVAGLELELAGAREAERARLTEIGRLQGQIDALSEANHSLKVGLI